jgi:hypothetical protein
MFLLAFNQLNFSFSDVQILSHKELERKKISDDVKSKRINLKHIDPKINPLNSGNGAAVIQVALHTNLFWTGIAAGIEVVLNEHVQ